MDWLVCKYTDVIYTIKNTNVSHWGGVSNWADFDGDDEKGSNDRCDSSDVDED